MNRRIPVVPSLLNIPNKEIDNHVRWYVDTVFQERDDKWWQKHEQTIKSQLDRNQESVWWMSCYKGSLSEKHIKKLNVTWIIEIPEKKMRMRTDLHTLQEQHPVWANIFSTNSQPIMIGYCTNKRNMIDKPPSENQIYMGQRYIVKIPT